METRAETASGRVRGVPDRGTVVFRGIPYARPPIHERAFRAPEPPDGWAGVRAANDFGSAAPQFVPRIRVLRGLIGVPADRQSQDCLTLNIWTPSADAGRRPVMVWIHGGAFVMGAGATFLYHGARLARRGEVVAVTINYRLGALGFLNHPELRARGIDANLGLRDQVRALAWVRENIGAFGGDPGNVTIFGESAGGTNVYSLLLSPHALGLFHRAVVESGGLGMSAPEQAEGVVDAGERDTSDEMILRLLVADGKAANRDAAKPLLAAMTPSAVEAYLRGKTSYEILAGNPPMPSGMIDMPKLFRDGAVLTAEEPMQALANGHYNRVPVMIGTTRDENKLFLSADPQQVTRVLWIFPRIRDEKSYNLTAEYLAKMWKATGADAPAAAMRRVQGASVFVYRFDWDEEPTMLGADLSVLLGAAHAFEIPFVFGHFDLGSRGNVIFTDENEPGRKALSAQMMSYWAEFAHAGAPGRGRGGDLSEWRAWDDSSPAAPKFLVFDTAAGGGVRMSSESVSASGVLAAVDEDPRLPTQREKCAIYRQLADFSRGFTREQYAHAGRSGCGDYPYDAYPWKG
jgi:para-nitrobenzyl esterase